MADGPRFVSSESTHRRNISALVGAGTAPVIIGYVAQRASLSYAISIASIALIAASVLLFAAIFFTVGKDVERLRRQLES